MYPKIFGVIVCILLITPGFGQQSTHNRILKELSEIPAHPEKHSFTNKLPVNNDGGHLQGVQLFHRGDSTYAMLSGSSGTDAYLAVVSLTERSRVKTVTRIFEKPLKHAGGFQLFENYLAVGVEDNDKRDRSLVCIYDVNDLARPLVQIPRQGDYEKATAGCVGLIRIPQHWLVVVGNWQTRDLDFYVSQDESITSGFQLRQSLTPDLVNKNGWIDEEWLAYQNINLLSNGEGLYLVGLRSDDNKQNIIDLYHLNLENSFSLTKLGRTRVENQGGDFNWGAGIILESGHLTGLVGCERNLEAQNHLYFYRRSKR